MRERERERERGRERFGECGGGQGDGGKGDGNKISARKREKRKPVNIFNEFAHTFISFQSIHENGMEVIPSKLTQTKSGSVHHVASRRQTNSRIKDSVPCDCRSTLQACERQVSCF